MRNAVSLNCALTTDILTPLMAHAALVGQSGSPSQARLLWVLIEDIDRKLLQVFAEVTAQCPSVRVKLPSLE